MNSKEVEYILAIAKNKSISKASEELYLSQPALSKFLINLESRIGITLFERRNNKLYITKAGEYFVSYAKVVNEQKQALDDKIERLKRTKENSVNVGICSNLAKLSLPAIIGDFKAIHPDSNLVIEEQLTWVAERGLLSGDLTLCITPPPQVKNEINYQPITREYVLLVLPRSHPLAGEGLEAPGMAYPWFDLQKLADTKFVLPHQDSRLRQYAEEAFAQARISPPVSLTTLGSVSTMQMVMGGLGAGITSELFLPDYDVSGKVTFFHIGKPVLKKTLGIAYRKGFDLPREARTLVQLFKQYNKLEVPPTAGYS